jgi:c-di-GMP-binding flagellar brake protein YcgR
MLIKERRGQKRNIINLPVAYSCSNKYKTYEFTSNDSTAFDLSDSGMSFYTNIPLNEGINLQVHTHIWNSPKASIVKWCSKKYINVYKVGISFR